MNTFVVTQFVVLICRRIDSATRKCQHVVQLSFRQQNLSGEIQAVKRVTQPFSAAVS